MSWRHFFRRAWWDDERARELESYIELETEDNIARGMSPADARDAARRKLGNTTRIREEIYAMNSVTLIDWLAQDLKYAARILRRAPGFTIAAVLTLSLGIGGVTVIYSALRNILLDPFPYVKSDRMVNVFVTDVETNRRVSGGAMGQDEFIDLLEQQKVFEAVVASATDNAVMRTATGWDVVSVTEMTPNTFPYLGVQPLKGRVFTEEDAKPGAAPVVVLDHGAWLDKFAGQDSVIGQTVTIGDTPRTIIGVMPPRFAWQAPHMWIPLTLRRGVTPPEERRFWYQAHLAPGVTLEQASNQMTAVAQRRALDRPNEYPPRVRVDVLDLRYRVVGKFSHVLYTLLAAVGVLLLIACCNVANMLLARATTREREMTLRAALGGGRLRITGHLLTESALLALGGAIGGCLLAWIGIPAVAAILPRQGVAYEVQLRLVPEALLVSLALAALTTLIVGIVPAWNASRQDLANGMRESGKGTGASQRYGCLRHGLVVLEVALSLVLLLGAGVLIKSFAALVSADLGVNPAGLALVVPRFEKRDEPGPAQRHLYYANAVARARSVNNVVGAALVSGWPYSGWPMTAARPGMPSPGGASRIVALFCDERYHGLVGLKPLRGRTFAPADISGGARVAVISRALAERYFGKEDPIGQYLDLPDLGKAPTSVADPRFNIIGVVEDVSNQGPGVPPWPGVYLPTTIMTVEGNAPRVILVRTAGDPAVVVPAIERAVRGVDPSILVRSGETLETVLRRVFQSQPRFSLVILTVFAVIGLLLVAVGVYGVMAYAVSQRRQEFAIRMALGATGGDVVRSVLRSGTILLGCGILIGLAASRVTNNLVSTVVFATKDADASLANVIAVSVIAAVGLAACLLPAQRASRTSPMAALRQD